MCELADELLGVKLRAGDHLLMDGRSGLLLEKLPAARGRGARARRGPRRLLRRRRRPRRPDRDDQGRGRAAVPLRRPVPRARAAAAEGHPAVRPARVAARRSSPRRSPTRSRKRVAEKTGNTDGPLVLPQHQGPRAPQQVRRRDRAPDPPDLPAGAREERRGLPGHRVLRRDGLAVPHPRHRHLVRHRDRRSCRSCSPRSTASRR